PLPASFCSSPASNGQWLRTVCGSALSVVFIPSGKPPCCPSWFSALLVSCSCSLAALLICWVTSPSLCCSATPSPWLLFSGCARRKTTIPHSRCPSGSL